MTYKYQIGDAERRRQSFDDLLDEGWKKLMHEAEGGRQRGHLVLGRQDDLRVTVADGNLGGDAVEELVAVFVVHVLTTRPHQLHWRKAVVETVER